MLKPILQQHFTGPSCLRMKLSIFYSISIRRLLIFVLVNFAYQGQSSGNVLYSGFQNRRNYWLEYSTPPTTLFPDYDEYDMYGTSTTPVPGPYFIEPFKNHSIKERPLGTAAHLNCRVGDLLENQVSWFRKQNTSLSLLTIGKDSFSPDPRYSVAFRKPENWRLKIRPIMAKDNGTYLCQVSTHPPILFLQHLRVIVPRVFLVDEDRSEIKEKHYKPGSTIDLHCIVTNYLPDFRKILWKHDGKPLTKNSKRGGISIKTNVGNGTVSSHLYLATASANDSGTYSCNVANMATATLMLHILNGEEPAAIQSSGANQVLLFSKPSVEKLCFRFSFIVPCKMCWHLSLLIFLIYLLSYKVCLPLQTSLPISKSVTYTNIHTTKTTSCKSLQMSGQKQNTGVGAICIQSTLNTNEQTNTTSSAAAFNSSCHKKSS